MAGPEWSCFTRFRNRVLMLWLVRRGGRSDSLRVSLPKPAHWLRKALNPLMERNLVEQQQADDGLSAHQSLGWIQLNNFPGCLPENSILGVIALNQSLKNQWLKPKSTLAFFPSSFLPIP